MKSSQNFEKNLSLFVLWSTMSFCRQFTFSAFCVRHNCAFPTNEFHFRQRKKYEGKVHSLLQCKSGDDEAENKRN